MIKPHATQIAKVDGQPSSPTIDQCPSPESRDGLSDDRLTAPQGDPESIGCTTSRSTAERSGEASQDALADSPSDDEQRWIETVIGSLKGRSPAARETLAKALLDGGSTVRPTNPNTHPVSGTSFPKTADFSRFSSRLGENCVTQPCHNVASNDLLTVWNRRPTSVSDCVTQV